MKRDTIRYYLLILILFSLCFIQLSIKGQTVTQVKRELIKQGVQHPEIVLKQSVLETGWYKSYSCKTRFNLFGFRYKGMYLIFNNWQESVEYYASWQRRHYKGGDYYEFLTKRGYATDPNYITKLKSIKL